MNKKIYGTSRCGFESFLDDFVNWFKKLDIYDACDVRVSEATCTKSKYFHIDDDEIRVSDHSSKNHYRELEFYDLDEFVTNFDELIKALENRDNVDIAREIERKLDDFTKKTKRRELSARKSVNSRRKSSAIQETTLLNDLISKGPAYEALLGKSKFTKRGKLKKHYRELYKSIKKIGFNNITLAQTESIVGMYNEIVDIFS